MTDDHDSGAPVPNAIGSAHPSPTRHRPARTNRRRPTGAAPRTATQSADRGPGWSCDWALPPLTPGAWQDVPPDDAEVALGIYAEDLSNEHVPCFLAGAEVERLRATPVSFYPNWMHFECQLTLRKGPRVLFSFLLGPDGAVLLDGTRAPINALAAHLGCDFSDASVARDYLHFHSAMQRAEKGRFLIVPSSDALTLRPDADASARAALAKAVRRPSQSPLGRDGTRFLTTVLYDGSLSYVTFLVSRDGKVVMEEDHLVMETVPVAPEYFEGPFRLVET